VFGLSSDRKVTEIVKGDEKIRFADFDIHPSAELIIAVQEDHRGSEVGNKLALIDIKSGKVNIVVEGADFYSHPKFNPDGTKISWLQWQHPDMPWTGTEVYVADWADGTVKNATKISGKAREESICQPKWHIDGSLLFCSDRTGFWQLYRYDGKVVEQLFMDGFADAEFGGPEFILGV
jgi:Tol biopolymer transport system component